MGTMRITVLYFAAVRDLVGVAEEALELPDDVRTVADLARHLPSRHPALEGRLGIVRFAQNEEMVDDLATALGDGDVIALIPPVAGG